MRCELRGQLEVEAGHDVGLELVVPTGSSRPTTLTALALLGEFGRDRGFLAALLDEVLVQAEPCGLAAGHGVVELAGEGGLLVGAARHPDVQPVLAPRT
jgi:hypothetical protein